MQGLSQTRESAKEKTCCVAGHHDIPADQLDYVKHALRQEIEAAIADGYQHFLTDFMEGADQLFAGIVADLMHENTSICMEAVLPCRSRMDELLADEVAKPLLLACADTSYTGEKYTPGCRTANRREQLKRSGRVIIVFDGRDKGETIEAIRMAHAQGVPIREIALGL